MKKIPFILILLIILSLTVSCREKDDENSLPQDDPTDINGADGGGFNGKDDELDYGMKSGFSNGESSFVMVAMVVSVGDFIEVDVISAPYENTGRFWVRTSQMTVVKNKDGDVISLSDLKNGDIVRITYSGQVMMSYPPQIVAHSVTVE